MFPLAFALLLSGCAALANLNRDIDWKGAEVACDSGYAACRQACDEYQNSTPAAHPRRTSP